MKYIKLALFSTFFTIYLFMAFYLGVIQNIEKVNFDNLITNNCLKTTLLWQPNYQQLQTEQPKGLTPIKLYTIFRKIWPKKYTIPSSDSSIPLSSPFIFNWILKLIDFPQQTRYNISAPHAWVDQAYIKYSHPLASPMK